MPEGDYFPKLAAGWQKLGRMINDALASDSEIAEGALTALKAELRASEGCPGLSEILDAFNWDGLSEFDPNSVQRRLMEILEQFHGTRQTQVAVNVAISELTRLQLSPSVIRDSSELLVAVGESFLDHHFFSRIRYELIQKGRFTDIGKAREYERRLKKAMRPRLLALMKQLVLKPLARHLQIPNVRTIPTAELLREELPLVGL